MPGDSLGYEGKTAESTLGLGRIKCSSLKLPCATCPSPLHSGVWHEAVPAFWGVSGPYNVAMKGRWGVKQKEKRCPQTQKCTRRSTYQLSKVNTFDIQTLREGSTRHASMWLFSYALFCCNQVEPPYFSVSYCGCAITEVGKATAAGSCLGAQVYSLSSSLKSDGKGTCFGAVAIEC